MYPKFSARISILFMCQMLSARIIFPGHQPSYPVQGFRLPLTCPTLRLGSSSFLMLRTLWLFYLYNGLDAVFSLQFRLPLLPSLPSSMAGFTLIPPLLLGDFISERNYSKCGCVPAGWTEQTKRMDGHCYLGRY